MDRIIIDCGEWVAIDCGLHPFIYIPKTAEDIVLGKIDSEEDKR